MAAKIADRWPLRLLMPGPLAEMARPWLPAKCEVFVTHGCQGGPIRRRIRGALRLGSMVAREPESVTYRHKLGQRRSILGKMEIALWRAIRRWANPENLARRVEAALPPKRHAREAVDGLRLLLWPTLIHTDNAELDLVKSARTDRCQILSIPASWDNLTSKGGYLVKPDGLAAWGEASKGHAIRHHGFRADQVVVTGPLHWEGYAESPHPLPELAGKPTVLVAGTSVNYWSDEWRILEALGQAGLTHDFRVLFRPHPRGAWGWHLRDVMPPGVSRDPQIERWIAQGRRGWSLDPADLAYYPHLMASVCAVVAAFSSMVIEAALLRKPSLLVAFGESRHGPGGAGMHVNYQHIAEVAAWPGVTVCRTLSEILDGVLRSVEHPGTNHVLQVKAQEVARVGGAQDRMLMEIERWMAS